MTPQEIFDQVVAHLRQQGVAAYDQDKASCMYRMPDGKKCAVGCLLLDSEYDPLMEVDFNVEAIFHSYPSIKERLGYKNLSLLGDLQKVHDQYSPNSWEQEWQKITTDYKLIYTPPLVALPQEDRNDPPG